MPSQLDIREWLMISDRICPRMRSTSLLVRSIRQQWASGEEDQGSTIIVQSTFRWIFSQLELTQDHIISWYSHSCSKWWGLITILTTVYIQFTISTTLVIRAWPMVSQMYTIMVQHYSPYSCPLQFQWKMLCIFSTAGALVVITV